MKILSEYINGNVYVKLYEDGTKERICYSDKPNVKFPESIDVKITDYCELKCDFCHENSTLSGRHGDLNKFLEVINELPSGVELALGGGNPLSHPNLIEFLEELKKRKIYANLTINQNQVNCELLINLITNDLIKGIGISITKGIDLKLYDTLAKLYKHTHNIVFHFVIGVSPHWWIEQLLDCHERTNEEITELNSMKVLFLGYKIFGRGIKHLASDPLVHDSINEWIREIPFVMNQKSKIIENITFSFDNLAIEQLEVKRLFKESDWNRFYMGDDFTHTMYIDAVKQYYAKTSTMALGNRTRFSDKSLLEYFKGK